MDTIDISGAEEHNLKGISLQIPKRQLIAFTGVSGSGKSSLIFDTLFAESFRRFADASQVPVHLMGRSSFALTRRPKFSSIKGLPPALGLSQRQGVAGKLSTVGTVAGVADLMRVYYAAFGEVFCRNCDIPLKSMSFADVLSAVSEKFAEQKIMFLAPVAEKRKGAFVDEIEKFRRFGFTKIRLNGTIERLDGPPQNLQLDARKLNTVELIVDAFTLRAERLPRAERAIIQAVDIAKLVKVESAEAHHGISEIYNLSSACPQCGESAPKLDPRHFSHSSLGKCQVCDGTGQSNEHGPGDLFPCKSCGGSRLDSGLPIVRVQEKTFTELSMQTLDGLQEFVTREYQKAHGKKARDKVLGELLRLLSVHHDLGIGHLHLLRSGNSLSPGDLQRLRLSSLLANRLRGALYVLDEPCQGLTREEVGLLLNYLRVFVEEGSTVLVVEHHPEFLRNCDQVFVMGPGAGEGGGRVVDILAGSAYDPKTELNHFEQNVKSKSSFLLQDDIARPMKSPSRERASQKPLQFKNFSIRNLNASHPRIKEVSIYPGAINLLRGPSGAGKSTFLSLCLAPVLARISKTPLDSEEFSKIPTFAKDPFKLEYDKSLEVQAVHLIKPGSLKRSSRRTVASALELLPILRQRFESLVSAQVLGLVAADFSWNSKKGQCETCTGKGFLEFEQKYAPPVQVICQVCNGAKLGRRSLVPKLRGLNFNEILELSIEKALVFFEHDKQLRLRLESAAEFGLGYVRLSQTMESLSGGEMQRLVLTLDLKRARIDGVWYLLTHPGTGLHLPDINVLGALLRRLIERGATFVITENREEFAEFADFVSTF